MAAKLPDGAIVSLATTYGTVLTVSGITNANPAVATSTAHGFINGDIVTLVSGWSNLNNRVVRVSGVTVNTFNLEGIDTVSLTLYPAGSGAGTAQKINAFTQIGQILDFSTSGGEQQFSTFSFLEQSFETQIPTITSAQSVTISIADDPVLLGYIALKVANDARAIRALRLTLPDNSLILYQGFVSFNESPILTKGSVMSVSATFSLQSRPVRYSI